MPIVGSDAASAGERAWLLCDLAEAYRFIDPRQGLAYLDQAAPLVEGAGDDGLAAWAPWLRARLRGFLGLPVAAELREALARFAALPEAVRLRIRADERWRLPGDGAFASMMAFLGRYDEALAVGERALAAVDADAAADADAAGRCT